MNKLKNLLHSIVAVLICIIHYPIYVVTKFFEVCFDWYEFMDFCEDSCNLLSRARFNLSLLLKKKKTKTKILDNFTKQIENLKHHNFISEKDYETYLKILRCTKSKNISS